jgi:hypothetical protein
MPITVSIVEDNDPLRGTLARDENQRRSAETPLRSPRRNFLLTGEKPRNTLAP